MDFEFWDRGWIGLHTISGGLVFVAGGLTTSHTNRGASISSTQTFMAYLHEGFDDLTALYHEGNKTLEMATWSVFKYLHDKVSGKTAWVRNNVDVDEFDQPKARAKDVWIYRRWWYQEGTAEGSGRTVSVSKQPVLLLSGDTIQHMITFACVYLWSYGWYTGFLEILWLRPALYDWHLWLRTWWI